MAKFNQFESENFGFSILGHLVVFGVIIFLADIVIGPTNRFVAPDHIQITMIDLSNVRITGDKSKLYNTNVPKKTEKEPTKPAEQMPQPQQDVQKKPIEKPTIVPPEDKKTPPPEEKQNPEKDAPDNKTAPTHTKIVRVSRNTTSPGNTMTESLRDALRTKMTGCWVIDNTRSDLADIRVVTHLKLYETGMVSSVKFDSESNDPASAYVLETIRHAINACQPFDLLPVSEYNEWREIQFTFYPTQGVVM